MPAKKPATPTRAALLATVPTPTLSLNLTSFSAITNGVFCALGNALAVPPIPQISIAFGNDPSDPAVELYNLAGGNLPPSGGVKVKKTADLSFGINPVGLAGGPFSIVGVTLVPLNGALTDNNITKAKWAPTAVSFTVKKGNKGGKWRFLISIVDTSSGLLGIIDPEIENDVSAITPLG